KKLRNPARSPKSLCRPESTKTRPSISRIRRMGNHSQAWRRLVRSRMRWKPFARCDVDTTIGSPLPRCSLGTSLPRLSPGTTLASSSLFDAIARPRMQRPSPRALGHEEREGQAYGGRAPLSTPNMTGQQGMPPCTGRVWIWMCTDLHALLRSSEAHSGQDLQPLTVYSRLSDSIGEIYAAKELNLFPQCVLKVSGKTFV